LLAQHRLGPEVHTRLEAREDLHEEREEAVKLRRAAPLVLHWHEGRLVVENYLTRRRAPATAAVLAVLDSAASGANLTDLARVVPAAPAQARRLVRALERATFLERVRSAGGALTLWKPWLPHAGLLHFGTRDEPYAPSREAAARFQRHALTVPPPPAVKAYRGAARISLPAPARLDLSLSDTLLARRTWRRFGRRPISIDDLSTLLSITWGIQQWARDGAGRRVALKTSPSGGAMHPGEVYVAAFNVRGVRRGLYHYDGGRHVLSRVRSPRQFVPSRYLPEQPWYAGAAALFLMTAVVARERWKYDSPRAYRAMVLDAGHLCQTFCLAATALQLAPFCSMALADSVVESDAGLDGFSEIALYAAGVGRRPAR
jgi:SagB-type dehydrogenase family enzyme